MKIERVIPQPQPEFRLTFSRDDGWTIVGALNLWVDTHKQAADREQTRSWAKQLDAELRRGL